MKDGRGKVDSGSILRASDDVGLKEQNDIGQVLLEVVFGVFRFEVRLEGGFIVEALPQQEAIELSFRQRIRTFLLNWSNLLPA